MRKMFKDKLASLGITIKEYLIDEDGAPSFCGIALVKNDTELYVIEQKPRGWGGDGKFRIWSSRDHGAREAAMEVPFDTYKTQREAIAGALKLIYNL